MILLNSYDQFEAAERLAKNNPSRSYVNGKRRSQMREATAHTPQAEQPQYIRMPNLPTEKRHDFVARKTLTKVTEMMSDGEWYTAEDIMQFHVYRTASKPYPKLVSRIVNDLRLLGAIIETRRANQVGHQYEVEYRMIKPHDGFRVMSKEEAKQRRKEMRECQHSE